jgi:hypothetical protein
VEPLFAELKNQIGLRRLRLRRLKFVREQFFLAAAAQNIKRLVRFLSKGPRPRCECKRDLSTATAHKLWSRTVAGGTWKLSHGNVDAVALDSLEVGRPLPFRARDAKLIRFRGPASF